MFDHFIFIEIFVSTADNLPTLKRGKERERERDKEGDAYFQSEKYNQNSPSILSHLILCSPIHPPSSHAKDVPTRLHCLSVCLSVYLSHYLPNSHTPSYLPPYLPHNVLVSLAEASWARLGWAVHTLSRISTRLRVDKGRKGKGESRGKKGNRTRLAVVEIA